MELVTRKWYQVLLQEACSPNPGLRGFRMQRCWKSTAAEPWETSKGGHNQNERQAAFQQHRTPGAGEPNFVCVLGDFSPLISIAVMEAYWKTVYSKAGVLYIAVNDTFISLIAIQLFES